MRLRWEQWFLSLQWSSPDRRPRAQRTRDLSHVIDESQQALEILWRCVGVEVDVVRDPCRTPALRVEAPSGPNPHTVELKARRPRFPVEIIQNAAGSGQVEKMRTGKRCLDS